MHSQPYSHLVRYKQWADRGLYDLLADNTDRLKAKDAIDMRCILDHIHTVDRIFQHHLQGRPHGFYAARSEPIPDLGRLAEDARDIGEWYVSYAESLSARALEQPVDFIFTSGKPGRMTRGEIILHVCLHGTYHRGNAGVVLLKNRILPNNDRLTDLLDSESHRECGVAV